MLGALIEIAEEKFPLSAQNQRFSQNNGMQNTSILNLRKQKAGFSADFSQIAEIRIPLFVRNRRFYRNNGNFGSVILLFHINIKEAAP